MEYQQAPLLSLPISVLLTPMEPLSETSPTEEVPRRKTTTTTKKGCRQQTLKFLDSRPALIAVCTLVVIECICVLVELMVDLQGIKFRFENEENEIQRFVDYLKKSYPDDFHSFQGRTMDDLLYKLKGNIHIKGEDDFYCMPCKCSCDLNVNSTSAKEYNRRLDAQSNRVMSVHSAAGSSESSNVNTSSSGDSVTTVPPRTKGTTELHKRDTVNRNYSEGDTYLSKPSNILTADNQGGELTLNNTLIDVKVIENGTILNESIPVDLSKVFVLEINNVKESFFLVAEYYPDHVAQDQTKHNHYHNEYDRIHTISTAIHLGSIAILSIMVIETFVKLFCLGSRFFKKKFEVFDAFIVIASFALDFIFLDSRWYETGKDATTILVLLLPWRVVRIVNSFLMTVNHKHHIEMMTIKRAKKKSELKNAKLSTLLAEIRRDVQLLVALCRSREIPEIEISACVYGKGRNKATIAAMSSFASLMLISTLGKNAVYEDDIYGKLFREALEDEDEDENGNDVKEETEVDEAIEIDVKPSKKVETKKKKPKRAIWKRSHTVPRRSHSYENIQNGNVFYVNDGYLSSAAKDDRGTSEEARRASFHSKASVRSTPVYTRGRNYVTFEVTTQVTYL